jgi:hypothetical protein
MASQVDIVKKYTYTNKDFYDISLNHNPNETDEETIEVTGAVAKLKKNKLDEIDQAIGAAVTTTDPLPTDKNNIVDGDLNTFAIFHSLAGTQPVEVVIDLGSILTVRKINLKHIYTAGRRYISVAIKISTDGISYTTIYNNNQIVYANLEVGINASYVEETNGLSINLNNLDCQYIKVFGYGSNVNPLQTEIREVEVYQALYWTNGYIEGKEKIFVNREHSVNTLVDEITVNKSGTEDIKYNAIIVQNGNRIPYFWDGSEWIISDGTYYQTNTALEINTNRTLLLDTRRKYQLGLRTWLKSEDDGSATPDITEIDFSAQLDTSYLPNKCKVYGYLTDIGIHTEGGSDIEVKIKLDDMNYLNNSNIITWKEEIVSVQDGYFETYLVPNATSTPIGKQYYITIKKSNKTIFEKQFSVPNDAKANIADLVII